MPKQLPEGWRQTYCAFIAEGYTHKDAADATGIAAGTVRRHLHEDDELRELYQEARESVRDKLRNKVWAKGMELETSDPQTVRWALDHLIKWNLPEARDTQQVDVNVAGTVGISHEARLTLAHVLGLASKLGLGESARGELPAAGEVLAESLEG